jgi:hypothetical protein
VLAHVTGLHFWHERSCFIERQTWNSSFIAKDLLKCSKSSHKMPGIPPSLPLNLCGAASSLMSSPSTQRDPVSLLRKLLIPKYTVEVLNLEIVTEGGGRPEHEGDGVIVMS